MHLASPSLQVKTLSHASGNAITGAPKFMLLGSKCVFAPANAGASDSAAYVVEGLFKGAAKTTGEAWAINAALYWNNSTSKFTTTNGGNTLCGYAASVQASGDTTGDVFLISLNP